jgi:hypothetical protein
MAVGLPLKTTYANGDVYSASDVNDTNGTINLFQTSTLSSQAGKNAIINGGMDIWQRGTSIALTAPATGYTADRWFCVTGTGVAATISRQATGDTTNLPSIQYCARVQRNSGQTGTAALSITTSLESVNSIPLAGKTVIVSFYARRGSNFSASGNTLFSPLVSGTGTDQNYASGYTGAVTVANQGNTLTTTWQRFTMTGTIGATATELALQFSYTPTGTASTNDYFEVTGVQVELGSTATTFSRAGGTIQGELAACQRYYYRMTSNWGGNYANFGTAVATSGTSAYGFTTVPVTMRVAPTSVDYATNRIWTGSALTFAINSFALTSFWTAPYQIGVTITVTSGLTNNQFYFFGSENSSSGYLGFSAEL